MMLIDDSVQLRSNIASRRSGSTVGSKTRRYKDKIKDMKSRIELLELENHALQMELNRRDGSIKKQRSMAENQMQT